MSPKTIEYRICRRLAGIRYRQKERPMYTTETSRALSRLFSELVNSRGRWLMSTGPKPTIRSAITAPQTRTSGARWISERWGG